MVSFLLFIALSAIADSSAYENPSFGLCRARVLQPMYRHCAQLDLTYCFVSPESGFLFPPHIGVPTSSHDENLSTVHCVIPYQPNNRSVCVC